MHWPPVAQWNSSLAQDPPRTMGKSVINNWNKYTNMTSWGVLLRRTRMGRLFQGRGWLYAGGTARGRTANSPLRLPWIFGKGELFIYEQNDVYCFILEFCYCFCFPATAEESSNDWIPKQGKTCAGHLRKEEMLFRFYRPTQLSKKRHDSCYVTKSRHVSGLVKTWQVVMYSKWSLVIYLFNFQE